MYFSLHSSISSKIALFTALAFFAFGLLWLFLSLPIPFLTGSGDLSVLTINTLLGLFLLSLLIAVLAGLTSHFQLGSLRKKPFIVQPNTSKRHGDTGDSNGDEIELLRNRIQQQEAQIQALLETMRDITDHIAHDILTPVTRLRGHAEIQLLREDTPLQVLESCGHAIEECDHILHFVNSVLKLAAVESGLRVWRWETLNLASLIQDGCDLFRPVMDYENHQLSMDVPNECFIRGDRQAVQRLIASLLDNAIKYTPSGGAISISLQQKNNEIELVVSDNGIGIDETEHNLIFQRFYRGDMSRSKPGHGLGLNFCYLIVKAMGGQIQVRSKRDQGSQFAVTFPKSIEQAA